MTGVQVGWGTGVPGTPARTRTPPKRHQENLLLSIYQTSSAYLSGRSLVGGACYPALPVPPVPRYPGGSGRARRAVRLLCRHPLPCPRTQTPPLGGAPRRAISSVAAALVPRYLHANFHSIFQKGQR